MKNREKKIAAVLLLIIFILSMFAGCAQGDADGRESKQSGSCTISITCSTILENVDVADSIKAILPEDGVILDETEVETEDGMNVFDVLLAVTRSNDIHMEFVETPIYGSAYIEGIANLYEFDGGELSGWMYSVNDEFPNVGCSSKDVKDGDVIKWIYTCDLGRDIGAENVNQASQ